MRPVTLPSRMPGRDTHTVVLGCRDDTPEYLRCVRCYGDGWVWDTWRDFGKGGDPVHRAAKTVCPRCGGEGEE